MKPATSAEERKHPRYQSPPYWSMKIGSILATSPELPPAGPELHLAALSVSEFSRKSIRGPDELLQGRQAVEALITAMATLPPNEALALRLRHGLFGEPPHSMEAITRQAGVSGQTIRKRLNRGALKLRDLLTRTRGMRVGPDQIEHAVRTLNKMQWGDVCAHGLSAAMRGAPGAGSDIVCDCYQCLPCSKTDGDLRLVKIKLEPSLSIFEVLICARCEKRARRRRKENAFTIRWGRWIWMAQENARKAEERERNHRWYAEHFPKDEDAHHRRWLAGAGVGVDIGPPAMPTYEQWIVAGRPPTYEQWIAGRPTARRG